MFKCVVVDFSYFWGKDVLFVYKMLESIIYEVYVKGLIVEWYDVDYLGKFLGMVLDLIFDYLNSLGVMVVELLLVYVFINDQFLIEKGLINYWGYMSYGFFVFDLWYLNFG